MLLESEDGKRVAMTDGRRLSRIWLGDDPKDALPKLGPDMFNQPWSVSELNKKLSGRSAPIKALLLDQVLFCGVGNWIADEVLFQAGIAPQRAAGELSTDELNRMLLSLSKILELAVSVGADAEQYPPTWLFKARWGGAKGQDAIDGSPIRRDTIGGRTTAWVPDRQK
jgi:formamidopyrimidine-DNA glycosylase